MPVTRKTSQRERTEITIYRHDRHGIFVSLWVALAGVPALAQTPTPSAPEPPAGVLYLPQNAPPTGLQSPLPPPALPLTKPDKPRQASPGLSTLAERMRTQPLTLQECVAISLATNRNLELAGEALLRAQGRFGEARTAFNPTLAGKMNYTRLNTSQSFSFGAQTITVLADSQRQVGAEATLPLDISGLLKAASDQAKFLEIAARLDINRTRNQIVADVKSAFYDVLRTQALVRVATENLQNSLDRLSDAEKKLKAGTVARFDVIRAQTDVANAQQQLITARTNVSLAIATLNNAIGLDIDTPLQITDKEAVEAPPLDANQKAPGTETQEPAEGQERPRLAITFDALNLGPEYEAVLKEALELRPELMQADANIAASKKGIHLARRSQLPSFGLSWGITYNPDAVGFAPLTTQWQAVASINIPLFDGGASRERVRQARADVATSETNRRQAVDLVTLEVRQSFLNLVQARNRVAVANQQLAQAKEAFRLARVRYNAGVSAQAGISPLLEVSDAQAALTQAESNQVNALYDYNNARARLDKAVGRYSFVLNGPGFPQPPSPKMVGRPDQGVKK